MWNVVRHGNAGMGDKCAMSDNCSFCHALYPNHYSDCNRIDAMSIKVDEDVQSKESNWVCHLTGDVDYHPGKGCEPNRWYRFWMRVFFGFKWERK